MTRLALITGASGGLGSAIAAKLAMEGYRLALHYYKNEDKAESVRRSLPALNGEHTLVEADLRNEAAIKSMTKQVLQEMGPIDVLINNAGIPFSGLSWKQSTEQWEEVFAINTTAAWMVSKYCIPMMREKNEGRIIYISSVVAHRPLTGTSAYAASKAALEGLTRAQAVELSRFGITVNCIAPGYFDAGMISSVEDNIRKELQKQTPAGRLGHASELAAAVVYLCSTDASFTTGQIIHINGGLYI
ncbi:MAG: 3-oxoacyl-ACP reductase FabG [Bacteroidetes bacterium]|nr:3-oxoacyl-ACP reductase FabG [Bacteroidota bacterium]